MKKILLAVCLFLTACGNVDTVKSESTIAMKTVTESLPTETGLLISFTANGLKGVTLSISGVEPKNIDRNNGEVFLHGNCSLAFAKQEYDKTISVVALDSDVLDKRYIFIPYVSANGVTISVVDSVNDDFKTVPIGVRFTLQEGL